MAAHEDERPEFFSELHKAWKDVETPRLKERRDELDPATRKAVDWMRGAWSEIEIPEPRLPRRPRLQLVTPMNTVRVLIASAAALMLAFLAWRFTQEDTDHGTPEGPLAQHEMAQEVAPTAAPVIASVGKNNIELRAGPVTLVLDTPRPRE